MSVFVVMGVSGCGKTTVGEALAETLQYRFFDADDFHPRQNIDKMARGEPLNDTDRQPWLEQLAELINTEKDGGIVLACSALKQSYRDILVAETVVTFIHLDGTPEVIAERMGRRKHFMPPALLESQFADLEPPKDAIRASIDQTVPEMLKDILQQIEI